MNWAIDQSLTPVAEKHHCVLFHLCDKVDNELKHLFDAGTIELYKVVGNSSSDCIKKKLRWN